MKNCQKLSNGTENGSVLRKDVPQQSNTFNFFFIDLPAGAPILIPFNQLTNRDNKDDLTIDLSQCQLCKKKMKIDHKDWSHALTNLQIGFIDLVFFYFKQRFDEKKTETSLRMAALASNIRRQEKWE